MLTRILVAFLLGALAYVVAKLVTPDERIASIIGVIVGVLVFLGGVSLT